MKLIDKLVEEIWDRESKRKRSKGRDKNEKEGKTDEEIWDRESKRKRNKGRDQNEKEVKTEKLKVI